ncbi:MAG: HAD hydrolase-like protein [Prevotellaceae bacterium]|nr:HAD hydrolase-like protein [Prevotella sp.]MDD7247439.1 HAD hydrolase-like protein [Prevotellaceae bacterium]MDY2749471.1 HAD hydrolase-like protein [Prevotella sp.]
MKYKILLLDLDGTLMDSGEGIMKCAQYALDKMGIAVDDWRSLRFFVGPPLEDSFKDFYGLSVEKAHEAVMAYRERYFSVGMLEQKPYDGVFTFLDTLKAMGITLCLATSKMMAQSHFAINHFGLNKYIDYVFARDDEGRLHTKADVIRSGLETLSVTDKGEVLMVGDRKFDVAGARECGIDSVGVLYGYGDREELEAAGATYICSTFGEVIDIIR